MLVGFLLFWIELSLTREEALMGVFRSFVGAIIVRGSADEFL